MEFREWIVDPYTHDRIDSPLYELKDDIVKFVNITGLTVRFYTNHYSWKEAQIGVYNGEFKSYVWGSKEK